MEKKLEQLKGLLNEVHDLGAVAAVLEWDAQVNMPPGGAEDRGHQAAVVARLVHEKFTSDEVGRLLDDLKGLEKSLDPTSEEARLLAVTRHDYEKETRVSADWVADFSLTTTVGQQVWQEAREKSQFSLFQPHLEKIVELRRQYAAFFRPYDHVYDPLVDDHEPGLKTAEIQQIFGALRPQQVALLKAIRERPQVDDAFIRTEYNQQAQWDFGVEVITRFGYDWKRGRQDRSAHPFTTSFGANDVRITTRFDPTSGASALFGTMHECGHALYEQGFSPSIQRTPLARGASSAFHESQSRMFENLVGRSLPFWKRFYPRLREMFPSQLWSVELEDFYRGINKVEPSFIRVEADEATYNLHIMLRMDLEIALMEGSLAVKDLPAAWNAQMADSLGITPADDAHGVLQDIHWSGGMFGYFPSYALGNLVSAQLWEKMQSDMPDLEGQIEQGEFGSMLAWLRTHIHSLGASYEPQDLIQRITGSKIDPQPYMRYLSRKYGDIYRL